MSRVPTRYSARKATQTGARARVPGGPGAVGDPGMCGRSLHGNREVSRGSVSPLEEFAVEILDLIAQRPDLTLVETVAELRKRRIKTSRSSLWRFLDRHNITLKKKSCKQPNGSEQMWRERAAAGYESKVCLILPGWCLSTRPPSARTW